MRRSDGRAGHISFGPYLSLKPGQYAAGFRVRRLEGSASRDVTIDVFSPSHSIIAYNRTNAADLFEDTLSLLVLEFEIDEAADATEVRLYVEAGVLIEVDEMVVFGRKQRNWGGQ